jgi:hypothetical protein
LIHFPMIVLVIHGLIDGIYDVIYSYHYDI